MSFTYGFYNSLNGDRKYNAEQMAAVFDCLINDGVQQNIGDKMMVKTSADALTVSVGSGRAWFNSTWSFNDSDYPFLLDSVATTGYSRIDAICLVVDKNVATRKNSLTVVKGTAAASPAKPAIPTASNRFYHVLGYVTVKYGNGVIPAAQIENRVGTVDCPFITGILETVTVDELLRQWRGEFDIWWETIKTILNDNVAANLQNQIDHLSVKEATMNLYGLSNIPTNTASTKKYAEYAVDALMNKLAVTTTTGNKFSVNPQSHATPLDAILNQISILLNNKLDSSKVSSMSFNGTFITGTQAVSGTTSSTNAGNKTITINFNYDINNGAFVYISWGCKATYSSTTSTMFMSAFYMAGAAMGVMEPQYSMSTSKYETGPKKFSLPYTKQVQSSGGAATIYGSTTINKTNVSVTANGISTGYATITTTYNILGFGIKL